MGQQNQGERRQTSLDLLNNDNDAHAPKNAMVLRRLLAGFECGPPLGRGRALGPEPAGCCQGNGEPVSARVQEPERRRLPVGWSRCQPDLRRRMLAGLP